MWDGLSMTLMRELSSLSDGRYQPGYSLLGPNQIVYSDNLLP